MEARGSAVTQGLRLGGGICEFGISDCDIEATRSCFRRQLKGSRAQKRHVMTERSPWTRLPVKQRTAWQKNERRCKKMLVTCQISSLAGRYRQISIRRGT